MSRLKQIRQAERESHMEIYSTAKLYEKGSWLQKPVKTVLDLMPLFQNYKELRVLDLGSGVGRNSIPIAQAYQHISCKIECVDILDLAIEQLREYAKMYQVEANIKGFAAPIEAYPVAENSYDLILAISALEHIDSKESFINKLHEISRGVRKNGIVCLIINSEVTEMDKTTKEALHPKFEVNLPEMELQNILTQSFSGWEIMKTTVREQQYDIPRENGVAELKTKVITYVARK